MQYQAATIKLLGKHTFLWPSNTFKASMDGCKMAPAKQNTVGSVLNAIC